MREAVGQKRTLCGDECIKATLGGTIGPWGMRSCAEEGCEIISRCYGRALTISQSM